MIDFENVYVLLQKELRDARHNRWFMLYAIIFAGLSLSLAWLALSGAGNFGLAGFGRTSASLINLVLLIVPLMGLTLGALSLAGEREKGTLIYLMAQPVNKIELLLGKFTGMALALVAAIGLGFGLTGLLIAVHGGGAEIKTYTLLLLLSCLLALASLSIGFLISALVSRGATAIGLALFLWLLLVFFGDLGLMGTAVVLHFNTSQLLTIALANPIQVFKLASILNLRQNLEVLGPAGIYAFRTYGQQLFPILTGLLILWIIIPFLISTQVFKHKGV